MAGLAAAGAAKSMGAIVRGFDTRYEMKEKGHLVFQTADSVLMVSDIDDKLSVRFLSGQQHLNSSSHLEQSLWK